MEALTEVRLPFFAYLASDADPSTLFACVYFMK